jgi:hypothetical protein
MIRPWQGPDPETLEAAAGEIAESVGDGAQRELRLACLVAWSKGQYQENGKADKAWKVWITKTCRVDERMAYRYAAAGEVLRDDSCQNALSKAFSASDQGSMYHGTLDLQKLDTLRELGGLRGRFLDEHPDWTKMTRSHLRREKILWWADQPEADDEIRKKAGQEKRKKTMAGGDGSALAQAVRKIAHSGDVKRRMAALECIDSDLLAHFRAACFMLCYKIDKKLAGPPLLDDLTEQVAGFLKDLQATQAEAVGQGKEEHGPDHTIHATRSDRVAVTAGTGR